MSFLEWIGESFDPGPSGSVQLGRARGSRRTNGAVLARLVITLVVIIGAYVLVFTTLASLTPMNIGIMTAIVIAYCLLGFFLRPEPDTSNMGWLGGLIDNPFRYSDDINRFLLFLKIFLVPGCFFAESIADGIQLFRRK